MASRSISAFSCSLPLMGIRNLANLLSTGPSGLNSLPLMGIRNRRRNHAERSQHPLTTPHGDQERREPTGSRRRASTAHYPSWGSGTRVAEIADELDMISLPLMGIRNKISVGAVHDLVVDSLPLMGIRNTALPEMSAADLPTHYPSWGSGTGATAMRERPPDRAHYPSWGSGTGRAAHAAAGDGWLTTPHGDQERAGRARSPRYPSAAHYPSWGSGTDPRTEEVLPELDLTTPHGDQEPPLCAPRRRCTRSHYPSWGSGTCGRRRPGQARKELTTPHGDQEPARPRGCPPCGPSHYPSWGSGTRLPVGPPA